MLKITRDETLELPVRLDAAKAVAPYVHPRLAVIDSTVRTEVTVSALTEEERRERARQALGARHHQTGTVLSGRHPGSQS
jgi:hypothetical protein